MEDPADAKARELDVEALLTQLLRSLILEQTAEGEVQS